MDVVPEVLNRTIWYAMPIEECFAIIEHGIGTDFDPRLARIFLNAKDEVVELMREKR